MKAIILAGGRGKRLRPITDKIPKPLIPINSMPLIERTIKYLKKYGINEIIISSGYKSNKIESFLKKKKNFGCQIIFSFEKTPFGTGGAIKKALKHVEEESFLVYTVLGSCGWGITMVLIGYFFGLTAFEMII